MPALRPIGQPGHTTTGKMLLVFASILLCAAYGHRHGTQAPADAPEGG